MKKISIYLLSLISVFMINGCGGSNSPFDSSSNVGHNIRMEKNRAYDVQQGDSVEKISENPELQVDANLSSGKTTVTLISGEAAIIKK